MFSLNWMGSVQLTLQMLLGYSYWSKVTNGRENNYIEGILRPAGIIDLERKKVRFCEELNEVILIDRIQKKPKRVIEVEEGSSEVVLPTVQVQDNKERKRAVIILEWDDMLCCTTFIMRKGFFNDFKSFTKEDWKLIGELDVAIVNLLTRAKQLSDHVYIISNSFKCHIRDICLRLLPKTYEYLFVDSHVPLIHSVPALAKYKIIYFRNILAKIPQLWSTKKEKSFYLVNLSVTRSSAVAGSYVSRRFRNCKHQIYRCCSQQKAYLQGSMDNGFIKRLDKLLVVEATTN